MAYQRNSNILVAIHAEATTGVAATATGAHQLRIIQSPGLRLTRAPIRSEEKRADSIRALGRLGGKSVEGSYNAHLTVGGAFNELWEGIMRATFATSTAIGFATVTSITTGTNEVVGNGDWVAQGIRVGDIFRLSGHATTANNDKNLRVVAVSSGTISVPAGSLTVDASADTAGTLTVLRKVVNGSSPTRKSFSIEQYDRDIDLSELFLGCRLVGMRLSCQPNQMANVTFTFMGIDRTKLETGTSPYFTSPTVTTGLALIADDSAIRFNGSEVTTFTGFDLDFTIDAAGQPVIGSFTSPDIFDNDLSITGTITGLREDFGNIDLYENETEFELSILLEEPGTAPLNCLSIFLPSVKITALSADVGGGDGAKIETREIEAGPKAAATGYDATAAAISTSAT